MSLCMLLFSLKTAWRNGEGKWKLIINFPSSIRNKRQNIFVPYRYTVTSASVCLSTLDVFIDDLTQTKMNKWKLKLNKQKLLSSAKVVSRISHHPFEKQVNSNTRERQSELDTSFGENDSLDNVILKTIDKGRYEDVILVLHCCVKQKKRLSGYILQELASVFAMLGNREGVLLVQSVCKQCDKDEFCNQAGYLHYLAEASWRSGNTKEALEMLETVYKQCPVLRKKLGSTVKFLVENTISSHGEAALVQLTEFSQLFVRKYGDFNFLSSLWQCCFLSEWFADQKLALELLEQSVELQDFVSSKIPIIVRTSLKNGQVETVHRLLEVLLRFGMKQQYASAVKDLFNYKCSIGDLEGCSAIVKSCLEFHITLTTTQHQRFLNLLLQHRSGQNTLFAKFVKGAQKPEPLVQPEISKFQLKF